MTEAERRQRRAAFAVIVTAFTLAFLAMGAIWVFGFWGATTLTAQVRAAYVGQVEDDADERPRRTRTRR